MDVWFTWCKRTARCSWCDSPIKVSEEMIVKKYWRKGIEDNRKWNIKFYYHPDCYIAEGRDYLRRNPYSACIAGVSRGRPALRLTPEAKRERDLILRRKAALEQRRKIIRQGDGHIADKALQEAKIDEKIAELMGEIMKVGGIPPSWLVEA